MSGEVMTSFSRAKGPSLGSTAMTRSILHNVMVMSMQALTVSLQSVGPRVGDLAI